MINYPFILRFQEFCIESDGPRPDLGTQTITNVRAEAGDTDRPRRKNEAFGAESASTLQTPIFVATGDEHDDKTKSSTMSITAVNAEAVDEDRAGSAAAAFPKERSVVSAGTQTHTRIQAEQSDEDRGRWESEAFRPCSLS